MSWIPDLSGAEGPIYRAIARALERDVAEGVVRRGEKLPPQRELARRLGVDLTTITRAFAEAAAAGLIVSEGRRGTFVRQETPAEDDVLPVEAASGMNMPPEPEDGSYRQRYVDGLAALMKDRSAPLHYQPAGGTEAQRAAAASLLSAIIPGTLADQCVVTSGSQHSLHSVLSLAAGPGDSVATPFHAYPGFLAAARRLGLALRPIASDGEGILPDALEAVARHGPLKALYIVPTNDNPTTATLPESRRKRIAALALRFGFAVIEDDAYGRLPARGSPPIASFAPERTWHLTTMSKLLSPSLRVGFVRAPTLRDALALADRTYETAGMPPPFNAALVARWIFDGSFERLLDSVRAEARIRMAQAAAVLGPLGARWHPEGYHLWLPLRPGINADRIAARAVAAGLPAVPGSIFAADPLEGSEALRISLGGSASRARLRREIARLGALVEESGKGIMV